MESIKGKALCRRFFTEIAQPLLQREFPMLRYSAGLLGYGSDVLGYDDAVSTDHMWGPRFYLFLSEEDITLQTSILDLFRREFPVEFLGCCVNFSAPNPNDGGVRVPEPVSQGPVEPLVFFYSFSGYLTEYIGLPSLDKLTPADWLAFPEHKLLALSSGEFYVDGLQLKEKLSPIRFYPEAVILYLIASNWSLIAEEQAFVRRTGDVGDELGSRMVCARIAERLMRLCFLYSGRYAPYSKWFGTAFSQLPLGEPIPKAIKAAVEAQSAPERAERIARAQKLVADLHNSLGLTEFVEAEIQPYFGRNIPVIFADRLAESARKKLEGTGLEHAPLIGTLSQVANFTCISDNPQYRESLKGLYFLQST